MKYAQSPQAATIRDKWIDLIRAQVEGQAEIRRGVCLLNAGQFDDAAAAFVRAKELGYSDQPLAAFMATLTKSGGPPNTSEDSPPTNLETEGGLTGRIRYALALWRSARHDEAIQTLRQGIRENHESPELHFQLGVLLASRACFDEAELRFVQAINLHPAHTEAMVNAAMCCAVRGEPAEALVLLQRAQKLRPFDAGIGLLLAQAANATQQMGMAVRFQAGMLSDEATSDLQGTEELARVIEADPDFVDAFLSIPIQESQQTVYLTLLRTLECALERQPEHAELHLHCGRVLDRLGRHEDAIKEGERAVSIEPRFVRALIELAKLYRQSARPGDAVQRLEQAIQAGGRYPDVYYLLGQLYAEQGQIGRARTAYRRAVVLNGRYEAAHEALALLPAEK